MSTSTIPFDTSLGPELVEFWTKKYKETKDELESLRENVSRDHLSVNCEILDIVRSIKNLVETREDVALRQELEAVTKERDELAVRFAHLEAERNALFTFSHPSLSSAAMSAFQQRRAAVDLRFPPVAFLAPTHQLSAMPFADYKKILQYLPTQFSTERLHFVQRPPASLPVCIPVLGQHGYWFDAPAEGPIHLIVEGRSDQWSYLGKYISAPLADFEMKLAEWMSLNEETRMTHCSRVAVLNAGLRDSHSVPLSEQIAARRKYDTGEWKIPCSSLQCVGYSIPLCRALEAAAVQARASQGDSSSQQTSLGTATSEGRTPPTKESKKHSSHEIVPSAVENVVKKARLSPEIMVKFE